MIFLCSLAFVDGTLVVCNYVSFISLGDLVLYNSLIAKNNYITGDGRKKVLRMDIDCYVCSV